MATKPTTEFQDAARDCAGLLVLLQRALREEVKTHEAAPNWANVGDMQRLREALRQALIPTRNCWDEVEAITEIGTELAKLRKDGVI